jgi:hypothetical protein
MVARKVCVNERIRKLSRRNVNADGQADQSGREAKNVESGGL